VKKQSPASHFRGNRSRTQKGPLSGVCVLVGRAQHQASALSAELREYGAQVLEIPFLEIRKPRSLAPLDRALKNIATYDWLILTSVNGVDAMWARMKQLRITKRKLATLKVAAIGPATSKAITKRGVNVAVVPEQYVAESVVQSLQGQVQAKRVLLVRAKVARDVIPRELRKAGAEVDVVEAYETVVPKSSRARLQAAFKDKNRPSIVTFTSSSSAKNFVTLLGKKRPRFNGIQLASIGPVTSATLRELNLPVDIEAREYAIPGLILAIVDSIRS
jgi:uroporphyrinogen-III synthase